ncbi:hypothetical protein LOCC1_G008309 [Lachnellula occidentalis]|uniref:Uncharacterized protein n=1 Tax=Lachnellula occidentalis TaxID=215460 RepID=A0A8H8RFU2_9HELO|nr:hypothetical protein LOCC1_G008309 [Lachnellula occidentalis]
MSSNEAYEPGAMYILLSTLANGGMHWGIFLMVSPPFGMIYNATDGSGSWKLDAHMTENVASSVNILAGLMIKRHIDENMQDQIHNVLTQVPCPPEGGYISQWGENFRCRIWVKDAVERLRLAGLIEDYPTEDIWDEAHNLGLSARSNGKRGLLQLSQIIF